MDQLPERDSTKHSFDLGWTDPFLFGMQRLNTTIPPRTWRCVHQHNACDTASDGRFRSRAMAKFLRWVCMYIQCGRTNCDHFAWSRAVLIHTDRGATYAPAHPLHDSVAINEPANQNRLRSSQHRQIPGWDVPAPIFIYHITQLWYHVPSQRVELAQEGVTRVSMRHHLSFCPLQGHRAGLVRWDLLGY